MLWVFCYTRHTMNYEIEIKSLLGSPEKAGSLVSKITQLGALEIGSSNQLNHYFTGHVTDKIIEVFSPLIDNQGHLDLLVRVVNEGDKHSIRTRQSDEDVMLVIKASIDDTTSENGIARIEFEHIFDMSLDDLDRLVLSAGFSYQAKWSRERIEYKLEDTTVAIDRNAGYGYVAEFEQVVTDPNHKDTVESRLRELMEQCGVEELPQDRLKRMFDHYNQNWKDFYGTENIFVIE